MNSAPKKPRWVSTQGPTPFRRIHADFRTAHLFACVFCQPADELVVAASRNFILLADPAPLVPGHLLLCSKAHVGCVGELPAPHLEELSRLRDYAALLLEATFGRPFYFEHGRAGSCMFNGVEERLCHHCHLHILPCDLDPSAAIQRRFRTIAISGLESLPELHEKYGNYLFYQPPGRKPTFVAAETDLEPHYFRTLLAQSLGRPERADWTSFDGQNLFEVGYARLMQMARQLASGTGPAAPVSLRVRNADAVGPHGLEEA